MKKSYFKEDNLRIVHAGRYFGNMKTDPIFYPENFTMERIIMHQQKVRDKIGFAYGFDGRKMYYASQFKDDGSYFEITNDYVEANPDGWTVIPEDILVMSDDVTGVAIGHAVADCAVVMACDKRQKVLSVGHCGHMHTTKMLPVSIIDALSKAYNSKDEDINVYVAPCASKDSYLYESFPVWGDRDVWKGQIEEDENGLFHINLKGAIKRQLLERNINEENIIISKTDTITNDMYYSNYAEKHGQPLKAGRNFMGGYFVKRR